MATVSQRRAEAARSKPIPIGQLAEEFLSVLIADGIGGSTLCVARQTMAIVTRMDGVRTTADLLLTPEFVGRFLEAWNGSTRHKTIVHRLNPLGKIARFCVMRGYLDPSEYDVRPIPVPPAWDEKHPLFRHADRPVLASHMDPGPIPTWEEFVVLTNYLKSHSGPRNGGRVFALYATIILARLNLAEAYAVEVKHINGRTLHIIGRERFREPHSPPDLDIPQLLRDIFDRWLPRVSCRWAFPDDMRVNPWDNVQDQARGKFTRALKKACREAVTRPFTARGLLRFGEANAARVGDRHDSPLAIAPGDGVLTLDCVPIAQFEQKIMEHYDKSSSSSLFMAKRFFQTLERLPNVVSTCNLTAEVVEQFPAAWGVSDPEKIKYVINWIQRICRLAIRFGYLDLDPFEGRPGLPRKSERTNHPKQSRIYRFIDTDRMARDAAKSDGGKGAVRSPWDDWDASKCPVHVRENGHLVVFERDKGPLKSENATQLASELTGLYIPGGRGGFDKGTLLTRFGTGARGLFARLKGIDADCNAAFQPPGPNKVGPYGIWRPDN